jgi:hypothetical protein
MLFEIIISKCEQHGSVVWPGASGDPFQRKLEYFGYKETQRLG